MSRLDGRWLSKSAIAIIPFIAASAATATTLHVCPVGCAFATIQSAVDSAVSGDVIQVGPGRYAEKVTITGKRLSLNGASAGLTEVVGSGHGPVFVLGEGSVSAYEEVDLQGMTISQGDHETGTGVGGGVQVRQGAFLHLLNSVVAHNTALYGGGVGVNTPGGPVSTIVNCLIDDNSSTSKGTLGGGGVVAVSGSTLDIQQSVITRNQAFDGGGVLADAGTRLSLEHVTVSNNTVTQIHVHLGFTGGVGGGLAVNGELAITDSIISDNATSGDEIALGGGLYVQLGSPASLTRTVIAHNSATGPAGAGDGGGIFVAAPNRSDTLALTQVYVIENQASPGSVGGVENQGTLLVKTSVFKDNTGSNCSGGTGCPP